MKTALIIVAYNSAENFSRLFPSLKETRTDFLWSDLIVVDNNSQDHSLAVVSEFFPQAVVYKNQKNLGFAAGVNQAAEMAFARGAEAVVLLNPDTHVMVGWWEPLVKSLADEFMGSAQPLMLRPNQNGNLVINTAGNILHWLGFGMCGLEGAPLDLAPKEVAEINYGSGGALAVRREVFKKIGGFDEKLFLYHEDVEFGLAVKFLGLKNVVVPQSLIVHHYEFRATEDFRFYYMERNRYLVWFKVWRWPTLIILLPFMLGAELGLIGFSFLRGKFLERPKIWLGVLVALGYFLNARGSFKRHATDREVFKSLSSAIRYQPTKNFVTDKIFSSGFKLMKRFILLFLWW